MALCVALVGNTVEGVNYVLTLLCSESVPRARSKKRDGRKIPCQARLIIEGCHFRLATQWMWSVPVSAEHQVLTKLVT